MNNSGRTLSTLNLESILKCWLGYCVGYWIKRYLYFSGLRGFMDRQAWARWALPLSRCVRRKHWLHVCAAQFHNIGGGQFCLPLTLLRLHWTLIVKILQILLGNLQTPNLNCPFVRHDFFPFTREELVLSIPCMAKLLFKWIDLFSSYVILFSGEIPLLSFYMHGNNTVRGKR